MLGERSKNKFLKTLTTNYVYDPAIALLGVLVYPTEMTTYVHTKTCVQIFIGALDTKAKKRRQLKWHHLLKDKRKDDIPSTGECYLAMKILIHTVTKMNLRNIVLVERSQTLKSTHHMNPLTQNVQKSEMYRDTKSITGGLRLGRDWE